MIRKKRIKMKNNNLEIFEEIKTWFEAKKFSNIKLENMINDAKGAKKRKLDFTIDYYLKFIPPSNEMIQVDIWLTSDKCIGLGIETRERLYSRMGKKKKTLGFAQGHESMRVKTEIIMKVLDILI